MKKFFKYISRLFQPLINFALIYLLGNSTNPDYLFFYSLFFAAQLLASQPLYQLIDNKIPLLFRHKSSSSVTNELVQIIKFSFFVIILTSAISTCLQITTFNLNFLPLYLIVLLTSFCNILSKAACCFLRVESKLIMANCFEFILIPSVRYFTFLFFLCSYFFKYDINSDLSFYISLIFCLCSVISFFVISFTLFFNKTFKPSNIKLTMLPPYDFNHLNVISLHPSLREFRALTPFVVLGFLVSLNGSLESVWSYKFFPENSFNILKFSQQISSLITIASSSILVNYSPEFLRTSFDNIQQKIMFFRKNLQIKPLIAALLASMFIFLIFALNIVPIPLILKEFRVDINVAVIIMVLANIMGTSLGPRSLLLYESGQELRLTYIILFSVLMKILITYFLSFVTIFTGSVSLAMINSLGLIVLNLSMWRLSSFVKE